MISTYSGTTSVYEKVGTDNYLYLGKLAASGTSTSKVYEKLGDGSYLYLGDLAASGTSTNKLYGKNQDSTYLYLGDIVPNESTTPEASTQGIHFITSIAKSRVNIWNDSPTVSDFEVWINGEKTNQLCNDITFSAGDDVLIKCVSDEGIFPDFDFSNLYGNRDFVREIVEPLPLIYTSDSGGWVPKTNFNHFLNACTTLTSIPHNLLWNNPQIVDFESALAKCYALTEIPADLFRYTPNMNSIAGCFYYCTALTLIPADLLRYMPDLTQAPTIFQNCSGLTEIPEDLFRYNTKLTHVQAAFGYCRNLTKVPLNLFKYNLKLYNVKNTFMYCSSLVVNLRIPAQEIVGCGGFAANSKAKGTVYVPDGSTTATNFKKISSNANVTVIEE